MAAPALEALLVDPALFTAPYDAALSAGLDAAGVGVTWATRPFRADEADALGAARVEAIYYRGVTASAKSGGAMLKLRKAASHLLGGLQLRRLARRGRFAVVHLQWAVVPLYDAWLMRSLDRHAAVILTVHDLEPFNGDPTSKLQIAGFDAALRAARRLIVHTQAAREKLVARGHGPRRVVTIPHGPLALTGVAAAPGAPRGARDATRRWRIVLFGKLQPYKGADVLVEALGRLSAEVRARLEVVVAGEPLTPMQPLVDRATALGLDATLAFRLRRHTEAEMAELFAEADAFVFPYRQIEASGVLHLVQPYRRWLIASDVGAFREAIAPGVNGERTAVGDPAALARALEASIGRHPAEDHDSGVMGWDEIGRRTRAVYEAAIAEGPVSGRRRSTRR